MTSPGNEVRRRGQRCVIAGLCLGVLAAAQAFPQGVVVEQVKVGRAAARAGIQVGDVLLRWQRAAAPPTNPEQARGSLGSPFDAVVVEQEQSPRGPVTLSGLRQETSVAVALPPGDWGLVVRPVFPPQQEERYLEAAHLFTEARPRDGARLLELLAGEAAADNNRVLAAWCLDRAARKLANARLWDEAQRLHTRAAEQAQGLPVLVQVLTNRVRTYHEQGKLGEAVSSARRCLQVQEGLSRHSLLWATAASNLAFLIRYSGDFQAAEQLFQQTVTLRQELAPDSLAVAESFMDLGTLVDERGEPTLAEQHYRRAVTLAEQAGDDSLVLSEALGLLATLLYGRGELDEAERMATQALAITDRIAPDTSWQAVRYANLASVISEQDRVREKVLLEQALKILQRDEPDSTTTAEVLNNLGIAAAKSGDLERAGELFTSLLQTSEEEAPDSLNTAFFANNLGTVYLDRGDLAAAEEHFQRCLTLLQQLAPGSLYEAYPSNNLGIVAERREDWDVAERWFSRALELRRTAAPQTLEVAASLNSLAGVARARGNLDEAVDWYQQDLEITRKQAPNGLHWARTSNDLGATLARMGKLDQAQDYLRRSLQIRSVLAPGTQSEAETLHELGMVAHQRGETQAALELLGQAVGALEQQISRLGGSNEQQAKYRARFRSFYTDLIELLLAAGRNEDAFDMLERSRARALLLLLAERELVFDADIPAELDLERRRINTDYEGIFSSLAKLDSSESESIAEQQRRLEQLRRRKQDLEQQIRRANPRLADLTSPEPITLAQAQSLLDPSSVALSYCSTPHHTIVFVLNREQLDVEVLPITEEELTSRVKLFRGLIEGLADESLIREAGARLYQELLAPVADHLTSAQRLLIVPDGALHLLPFAALTRSAAAGQRYLAQDLPITTVVSLTVLRQLDRHAGADTTDVAVFADPSFSHEPSIVTRLVLRGRQLAALPAARAEAAVIGQLYGKSTALWLGAQASESRAKAIPATTGILHFATHVILDEQHPLDSCIALATPAPGDTENGFLAAWEVLESLRLDADLVTLSGCSTALGEEVSGEGLIGLTRAFEYAGARSVLASLWQVEDQSTAALMQRFHTHLHAGLSRDEALRRAQCELIEGPVEVQELERGLFARLGALLGAQPSAVDATHPFYWASFKLEGAWH